MRPLFQHQHAATGEAATAAVKIPAALREIPRPLVRELRIPRTFPPESNDQRDGPVRALSGATPITAT
jgi:hypothetical protein